MMKRNQIGLAVLLAIGLAGTALAAGAFDVIDSNGDGMVSREELQLRHEVQVQTKTEAGMQLRNMQQPDFAQFDKDGDGMLNQNEYQEMHNWQLSHRDMTQTGTQAGPAAGGGMGTGMGGGMGGGAGKGK
jgi:hypothetical protein